MSKKVDPIMEEFMAVNARIWPTDESMLNYIRKTTAKVVKMDDGRLYDIKKPNIETSFCFGESGYDWDEAQTKVSRCYSDEAFFIEQNERKLLEKIDCIKNGELYIITPTIEGLANVVFAPKHIGPGQYYERYECRKASNEERERLLEAHKEVLKRFDTRLRAYLKRYGLKNVNAWSYWRDA